MSKRRKRPAIDLLAFKHQPHDKYAKFVLQTREVALELLQFSLPEQVLSEIDLNTLELSQDSFIDNKLSAHFSDVCYVGQTNAQKPLRIAIVFEHKSAKPDSPLAGMTGQSYSTVTPSTATKSNTRCVPRPECETSSSTNSGPPKKTILVLDDFKALGYRIPSIFPLVN